MTPWEATTFAHVRAPFALLAVALVTLTAHEATCQRARVSSRGAQPFDVIVRAHRDALSAFAHRLCRDSAEANDLVQDTFERALRRYDSLAPNTNPRAWLFTILHNGFIDRCRRKQGEPRFEPVDEGELSSAATAPEPTTPSWMVLGEEEIAAAIAALDDDFRIVYRMHAIDRRSYDDIAKTLGIPQNTVGTRLSRARRKLREILERTMEER